MTAYENRFCMRFPLCSVGLYLIGVAVDIVRLCLDCIQTIAMSPCVARKLCRNRHHCNMHHGTCHWGAQTCVFRLVGIADSCMLPNSSMVVTAQSSLLTSL